MMSCLLLLLAGALPEKNARNPAEQPYRIHVWMDFEQHPRFSHGLRNWLEQQFRTHADRYLAGAWQLKFDKRPENISAANLPTTKQLVELDLQADKLLWIQIASRASAESSNRSAVRIAAWEYDFRFDDWCGPGEIIATVDDKLGDQLFLAGYQQFRPHAVVIGPDENGKIEIQIQGLALQPADSARPLAPAGMPFRVFREFRSSDGTVTLTEIPYTFLLYRNPGRDRVTAYCDLVSALRSALSRRTRSRATMLALGSSQAATATTRVRFVTGKDETPVVGLEVSLRPQDRRARVPVGTTDHQGQIVVAPVRLASEVGQDIPHTRMYELRLSTGDAVIASLPLIPGETDDLEVPVQVDPLLTEISGMVVGLQDELLDAVVARKVLSTQLEQLASEGQVEQAQEVAKQLNKESDLEYFQKKLQEIKAHAERRREELERPTLGGTIARLFVQSENLLKKFGNELVGRQIQVSETTLVPPQETPEPEPTEEPEKPAKKEPAIKVKAERKPIKRAR